MFAPVALHERLDPTRRLILGDTRSNELRDLENPPVARADRSDRIVLEDRSDIIGRNTIYTISDIYAIFFNGRGG
ncbi:MAG: hypothetical protein AAFN41_11950 [Planctomycetota bacterium]